MKPGFIVADDAEQDLADYFLFIEAHQPVAARRFIEQAYQAFEQLAETPKIGRVRRLKQRRHREVRSIPIHGFRNFIVFYEVTHEGVTILHVTHGARDVGRLLREEW